MTTNIKAYLIGGGIGSLAAAAFMIRDGKIKGDQISILEAGSLIGGSLDGAGDPEQGYSLRGGRMLTTDNYECTWDLFKSIPSLHHPGKSVFEETQEFNQHFQSNSKARLVDKRRARVPVTSMGFSMHDRMELLKLTMTEEVDIGNGRITDWLSPSIFDTEFWFMWATTFAFQPWHSAVEFKRYLHRFMMEFSRIETLAGVKRTVYNQYDSLVLPLQTWLKQNGVHFITNCQIQRLTHTVNDSSLTVTGLDCLRDGIQESIVVNEGDLVFLQNGSMTDASSLGSMSSAPEKRSKLDSNGWRLWEQLAAERPGMGNPTAFNSCIAQSNWESFTVTLKDPRFFNLMQEFSGNEAGTGGLVTFKDSNWLMSIVLAHQPHFINQPEGIQVFWGYALFPDRIGDYVAKPMSECNGAEILQELLGHLRFDTEVFDNAHCIPCRMPYITSMFMPRSAGDRPLPVPPGTRNFAFISQFVEIPDDVVFTVEYSVRAAQMAVYKLLAVDRQVPPVTAHDKSIGTKMEAFIKAFK
ncbi:oleate hydratase [Undibacterium sp. Di26W]|uniref:oleate hydratase n=1 Tax=Undibacterium sp. Di26W TaxID=3413035 RepID=UPI003BF27D9B